MQRLARITLTQENQQAIELFNQFKDIKPFLLRHLPPSTLQLFAEPVVKGEVVEWYSALQGQPLKLSAKQQESLLNGIQNKLASISNLVVDLQSKNQISAEKAQSIRALLEAVNYSEKEIYSVNGEPVIVGWGIGKPPSSPPPVNSVVAAPFFTRHRWCCWLLPLLLLLLGLLAWWWFYLRQPEPLPAPPPPPKTEEVVKKEEVKPEPPKAEVSAKVEEATKEAPPPKAEEPVKPEEPPKIEEPVKVEEPKIETTKAEQVKKEEKPKIEKEEPKKNCTVKMTKPEELPQMVIVFDNSPSMLSSLNESNATMEEFWARWSRDMTSIEENRHMLRAPNRLMVAKKSAASIINNVAPNVPIGFVTLSTCPSAHNHGFYEQSDRGTLKAAINDIFPFVERSTYRVSLTRQTGTPLYSGLQKAAAMVDGKNQDAFILVISDGENSCDQTQDVCALAAQIARQKPKLRINVVDIGGAKGANCVAHATKGKVFTANSQKQISSMISQAVKPMQTEEICK